MGPLAGPPLYALAKVAGRKGDTMKVYICKTCGFFGFAPWHSSPVVCASCGEPIPIEAQSDLGPQGMEKYQAISQGLGEYEATRCAKNQISLFG